MSIIKIFCVVLFVWGCSLLYSFYDWKSEVLLKLNDFDYKLFSLA